MVPLARKGLSPSGVETQSIPHWNRISSDLLSVVFTFCTSPELMSRCRRVSRSWENVSKRFQSSDANTQVWIQETCNSNHSYDPASLQHAHSLRVSMHKVSDAGIAERVLPQLHRLEKLEYEIQTQFNPNARTEYAPDAVRYPPPEGIPLPLSTWHLQGLRELTIRSPQLRYAVPPIHCSFDALRMNLPMLNSCVLGNVRFVDVCRDPVLEAGGPVTRPVWNIRSLSLTSVVLVDCETEELAAQHGVDCPLLERFHYRFTTAYTTTSDMHQLVFFAANSPRLEQLASSHYAGDRPDLECYRRWFPSLVELDLHDQRIQVYPPLVHTLSLRQPRALCISLSPIALRNIHTLSLGGVLNRADEFDGHMAQLACLPALATLHWYVSDVSDQLRYLAKLHPLPRFPDPYQALNASQTLVELILHCKYCPVYRFTRAIGAEPCTCCVFDESGRLCSTTYPLFRR